MSDDGGLFRYLSGSIIIHHWCLLQHPQSHNLKKLKNQRKEAIIIKA
jgi:hypothetical protein